VFDATAEHATINEKLKQLIGEMGDQQYQLVLNKAHGGNH
jgi:hypothetical protein